MNRSIQMFLLLLIAGFSMPVAILADKPLETYEELCQEGRKQLANGHLDEAVDNYTKATEEEPSEPLAFVSRALVYCAKGEYEDAKTDAEKAIELNAEDIDAHLALATALRLMKQYEKAEKTLDHILYELDDSSADAYADRGTLFMEIKDNRRARRDFSKAIALAPEREDIYIQRASICQQQSELGQAIRDYSSAIELNDEVPEYYFLRAQVRLADKRYREALADARTATEAVPDYVAAYGIQVAALFSLEQYEEADEALKQAEHHAETEPGVLLWRGRLLAAEKKYEEAITKYEQALKIDPEFLPALESSIDAYKALEVEETISSLKTRIEEIEQEQEKRAKDEHLLWSVVQGIPGASRDLTDERMQDIAARQRRDESAKQLARQFAEKARKQSQGIQEECQEIEIGEVVPAECESAEAVLSTGDKRFKEGAYELAAADFKQGEIRYGVALDAYEDIVSEDDALWAKWAFERASDMDDDYAPVMTWLTLAEACHAMGDNHGYRRAIDKAMALTDSVGLLNPNRGCSAMLRISRLRVKCDDMEGAAKSVRAAADFCEGISHQATRAASLARCAGAAIRCDERDLWPVYLTKAVEMTERLEFSRKEYRMRQVEYMKHVAYMEARATEEAFLHAQNVDRIVARRANDNDAQLNADVYSGVAYAAMQGGCTEETERKLFETSYLKAIDASVTKHFGRDFAVGARYVMALADAAGNEYVRAWCGTTVLADPGAVALVGGRAVRVACQQGKLDDAWTMYGAFLKSYPSAAAVRHLAEAEVRLGDKSCVELRHWVHDMPQKASQAAALIGLAAGIKTGRTSDISMSVDSPTSTEGESEISLEDILKLHSEGESERAMELLARRLNGSRMEEELAAVFDTVAADVPVWWLKEAERCIGQIEDPHVRAVLWLQIVRTHLAADDKDAVHSTLQKIDSCWIAMWSRIYTRRCPPDIGHDGQPYWKFNHDLEESETNEIRAMLEVLFDIEEIQNDLGEKQQSLETLLLAAHCAEMMPRRSGFTASLTPSYTSLWLNRIAGRLKLRGREELARIITSPLPGEEHGVNYWPINWYKYSQSTLEAQDTEGLKQVAQASEEHSHDGAGFTYSALIYAELALAQARRGDTDGYRKAAMRAASLAKRGKETSIRYVLCNLARAAVAMGMPESGREYAKQAKANYYYEERDPVLSEIAQGFAKQGDIEEAVELADEIHLIIPLVAAQRAIFLAKAVKSKDNLSEIYAEIQGHREPSDRAAAYAAVSTALIAE